MVVAGLIFAGKKIAAERGSGAEDSKVVWRDGGVGDGLRLPALSGKTAGAVLVGCGHRGEDARLAAPRAVVGGRDGVRVVLHHLCIGVHRRYGDHILSMA